MIYANADGIQIAGTSTTFADASQRCLIQNNTIIRNSEWAIRLGLGEGNHDGLGVTDCEIINNILWTNTSGTIQYDTNYGAAGDQVETSNETTTDPGFTDDTNADRSLWDLTVPSDGSVIVDNGADTSADVPVDYLGFPNITVFDVGAAFRPAAASPPLDPTLVNPSALLTTPNTNKLLSGVSVLDQNSPEIGGYSVRIVVSAGTLNDGV